MAADKHLSACSSGLILCRRYEQFILLGRVALVAQRPIVIKLSRGRSVGRCVGLSSALWKNGGSDRIRMPFRIVGRTGPRIRHVVRFWDRSTKRGTFGGEFGARHSNQWGLTFAATRRSSQITLD